MSGFLSIEIDTDFLVDYNYTFQDSLYQQNANYHTGFVHIQILIQMQADKKKTTIVQSNDFTSVCIPYMYLYLYIYAEIIY